MRDLHGTHPDRTTPAAVTVQLDLFGAVAANLEQQADEQAQRDARNHRFHQLAHHHPDGTPVLWTAPWDTAGGMREGESAPGARCWLCGQVEPNDTLLRINHGLSPWTDWDMQRTECTRQWLQASQAASQAAAAHQGR